MNWFTVHRFEREQQATARLGDHEHLTSSTLIDVCWIINFVSIAAALASLPSKRINVGRYRWPVGHVSRTVNDYLDLFINTLHFVAYVSYFVTHALHFSVDYFYFVADAVRDPQDLRKRHPSLFLCQFIQPLECILEVSPSCQFLQELFYAQFS